MSKRKSVDIAMEMRLHIIRKYKNQTAAAEHFGVSQSMISDIVRGRRDPTNKMLDEIGFERVQAVAEYVRK